MEIQSPDKSTKMPTEDEKRLPDKPTKMLTEDEKRRRMILIIANIICLVAGMVTLSVGIVAKVRPELIFKILGKVPGTLEVPATFDLGGIITASAVCMTILGAVVTVVGLFGLIMIYIQCSDKKKRMIAVDIVYIVVLVIMLLAELALIIFALAFPEKLKEFTQQVMDKSLNRFKEDVRFENGTLKISNHGVSLGWTVLQLEVDCCGAYNYTDFRKWNNTVMYNGKTISASVPISCCAKNETLNLASSESYDVSIFTNLEACLKREVAYINPKNCYDALHDIILQSKGKVIVVLAAIIGEEVLLISLAVAMYCQAKEIVTSGNGQ